MMNERCFEWWIIWKCTCNPRIFCKILASIHLGKPGSTVYWADEFSFTFVQNIFVSKFTFYFRSSHWRCPCSFLLLRLTWRLLCGASPALASHWRLCLTDGGYLWRRFTGTCLLMFILLLHSLYSSKQEVELGFEIVISNDCWIAWFYKRIMIQTQNVKYNQSMLNT